MTITSSVTRDNLFSASEYPRRKRAIIVGASQTLVRGSVLGRVAIVVGEAAVDAGAAGGGAVTGLAALANKVPLVGTYVLTCVAEAVGGGTFHLVDPLGNLVGVVTVGTAFVGGGLTLTVTADGADWEIGDVITIPITAGSGQRKLLDKTATDGSQMFAGVLLRDVTTGAGETAANVEAYVGAFQSQSLVFADGTTLADVINQMIAADCHVDVNYAVENVGQ